MSIIETISFITMAAMIIGFFSWVAYLAFKE